MKHSSCPRSVRRQRAKSLRHIASIAFVAIVASSASAGADETRAIVNAATTYFARYEFTSLEYSRASVVRSGDFAVFSAINGFEASGAILRRRDGHWHVLTDEKGIFDEYMFTSAGASLDAAERLTVPCPPQTGVTAVSPTPIAVRNDSTGYAVTTASHRVVRVTVHTIVIPTERIRFATVDPPIAKIIPRTVVTVCE